MKYYHGMTLIELLFGIILLGILSSLGFPSFQQVYENRSIRSSVSEMQRLVYTAKNETVTKKNHISLSLQGIKKTVKEDNESWAVFFFTDKGSLLGEINSHHFSNIEIINKQSSNDYLFSKLDGKINTNLCLIISLKNNAKQQVLFRVSEMTGRTEICSIKGALYDAC